MTKTIVDTTVTWMPVGRPAAASPHGSGAGLLPVMPGSVVSGGHVCPSGGIPGAASTLRRREAMSGVLATGLPGYRSAELTQTVDLTQAVELTQTVDVRPAAFAQGAFLAGVAVQITAATTNVPTTPVRHEKQHPGPSVLRPPV